MWPSTTSQPEAKITGYIPCPISDRPTSDRPVADGIHSMTSTEGIMTTLLFALPF
ncbi:MAG: hypothetical protein VKL39_08175 [Leptolyngbyaceae bacterium]|nr:hypothetical protein [Leptolyngbyaceae bacterium]